MKRQTSDESGANLTVSPAPRGARANSAGLSPPHEQFVQFEDMQAVKQIPGKPVERDTLFQEMREQVFFWLNDRLLQDDRAQLWSAIRAAPETTMLWEITAGLPTHVANRVNMAFDDLILEQARIIGVRVFWSRDVLQRILEWEHDPDGSRRYKNLGKELARRATPGTTVELSEKLRPFRQQIIEELKQLRNILLGRFTHKRGPDPATLMNAVLQIVGDQDEPYDRLRANLYAFRLFLRANPNVLPNWVFGGRMTTTKLAEEFMAHSTCRSPEALRQAIAGMRRRVPIESVRKK